MRAKDIIYLALAYLFLTSCSQQEDRSSLNSRANIVSMIRNGDGTYRIVCEKLLLGLNYVHERVPASVVEGRSQDRLCNGIDLHLSNQFSVKIQSLDSFSTYRFVSDFILESADESEGYDLKLMKWHTGERWMQPLTSHSSVVNARSRGSYRFIFDVEYVFGAGPGFRCPGQSQHSTISTYNCVDSTQIQVSIFPPESVSSRLSEGVVKVDAYFAHWHLTAGNGAPVYGVQLAGEAPWGKIVFDQASQSSISDHGFPALVLAHFEPKRAIPSHW